VSGSARSKAIWFFAFGIIGFFSTVAAYVESTDLDKRLENISSAQTGGESYAYVVPQVEAAQLKIHLVTWNAGKNSLNGVALKLVNSRAFSDGTLEDQPYIDVGVLAPNGFRELEETIVPHLDKSGVDTYIAYISAQNGMVTEILQFRKGRYAVPWAYKFRVEKQLPVSGHPNAFTNLVLQSRGWSDDLGEGKPIAHGE